MLFLDKITDDPYQQFFLTGIPGISVDLTLRYLPTQNVWRFDIAQGEFIVNGLIVVSSLNILRQFRRVIPFGLACITADGRDPYYVSDFAEQRSTLILLTAEDVLEIEENFYS